MELGEAKLSVGLLLVKGEAAVVVVANRTRISRSDADSRNRELRFVLIVLGFAWLQPDVEDASRLLR